MSKAGNWVPIDKGAVKTLVMIWNYITCKIVETTLAMISCGGRGTGLAIPQT